MSIRVAAYCRVSTDSEDQFNSYKSQVTCYTDLIKKKHEWTLADIYADEAITGTQVAKREDFQRMINDCMNGDIDMVITKSISRFARNTLDTLKYVRMLKEKGIAVFFEDENINTLTMDGELLLVVLSSVAQQEVENISSNVKRGLKMKMQRGELVGFQGCLGHSSSAYTKTIWQCVTDTKNGKRHCPHCKGIPEEVIEKAFVKSYQLLCTDQQEVVDEFLQKVEGILNDDTSLKRLPKIEKEMSDLHRRKEKLLDLRLDNNIDRDIYEKKNQELSDQLNKLQEEQQQLMELSENQENTRTRLREFRKVLGSGEILENFDRVVFESVVEKIIIGGYNDEGVEEPLKITFVYKTGIHSNFNGKDFKPKRKNAAAVHNVLFLSAYSTSSAWAGIFIHLRISAGKIEISSWRTERRKYF